MRNILLAGVGGQGTVLASKIIAATAMKKGEPAHTAETIGMAQRGGSVVSHVRIGSDAFSPLIPLGCADAIIGFEPSEAVRALPYLKPQGTVIVSTTAIKPVTDSLSATGYDSGAMLDYLRGQDIKLVIVNSDKITEACGSSKVLNMALLGAASAAGAIEAAIDELGATIAETLSPKFKDINLAALSMGALAGQNK